MVRSVFAPASPGQLPRWLRWLLLLLPLVLLLLCGLLACDESQKPESLATSALAGPRLTTGPVCFEEAVDVSRSMDVYTAQRERAEREFFTFARRELGDDDLFSEAYFAASAAAVVPPTRVTQLDATPGVPGGLDYQSTRLAPAVDALVAARPAGPDRCAARALVIITDGEIFDAATVAPSLQAGNYTRMFAVVPSAEGWGRPDRLRGDILDAIAVYHFHEGGLSGRVASVLNGAKPLDVIFGEIIGSLTGQALTRTEVAQPTGTP